MSCQKNIKTSGIKSATVLKNDLIANQHAMKNS